MDTKVQKITSAPNYQRIYGDIIEQKFPDKMNECKKLLEKQFLCTLDIILLNKILFNKISIDTKVFNQKHRTYDERSIIKILAYQQKNRLNNTQLANLYKLSRNTVANWKKQFSSKAAKRYSTDAV